MRDRLAPLRCLPRYDSLQGILTNVKLTQVSSLFRIEEFHILVDQGVVEVTPQVLCDPFTYQVVEISSDKYADGLTLYLNFV